MLLFKKKTQACQYHPRQLAASRRLLKKNSLVKPDGDVGMDGRLVIEDVGFSVVIDVVGRLEMKVEESVEAIVDGEEVVVGKGAGGVLLVVVIGTVVMVLGVEVVSLVVVDAGAEVGDTFGWGVNVSVWP